MIIGEKAKKISKIRLFLGFLKEYINLIHYN